MYSATIQYRQSERLAPKDIRELREKRLGLSQEAFAYLLSVSIGTVSRWERGEVQPDEETGRRLVRVRYIAAALSAVMDPRTLVEWLETPREEFDGNPPRDLLGSRYATAHLAHCIDRWSAGSPLR